MCTSPSHFGGTLVASSALVSVSLFLRAVLFFLLLPGTVVVLVPWLLVDSGRWRTDLGAVRFAGVPLVAAGAVGLLWCIWDFAHRGRGTLAPVDPPRFIVRTGLYRLVRNPMYVSNLVTLIGVSVFFGSAAVLAWAGFMWVANHLFVVLYEEPALSAAFGADYEEYRRRVPRWAPKRPKEPWPA